MILEAILPKAIRRKLPMHDLGTLQKVILFLLAGYLIYVFLWPKTVDVGPYGLGKVKEEDEEDVDPYKDRDVITIKPPVKGESTEFVEGTEDTEDTEEIFGEPTLEIKTSIGTSNGDSDSAYAGNADIDQCLSIWGKLHEDVDEDMNQQGCPFDPPEELVNQFTLNGTIKIFHWYKCQTGPDYAKKHSYSQQQIDDVKKSIGNRLPMYYGETDLFLYESLERYPIKDNSVVVMGSQRPIYESICSEFGASQCSVIDFQPITSADKTIEYITIAEYDKNPRTFDAAISISSFEHDGLGRYGDPMRPHGDLDMMKKMKCIVNPGGYLYLSVPIAKDKIVWNMHRVYGNIRLPLLFQNWKLVDFFGVKYEMTRRYSGCDAGGEGDFQPIFVLQNVDPENSETWDAHNKNFLKQFLNAELQKKEHSCFA